MQIGFPISEGKQHVGFFTNLMHQGLSSAGMAIGTSSKKALKIANTVVYSVWGSIKSKTTAEIAFTATTMDIPASAASVREACYIVSLDASGTATITMGAITSGAGTARFPATPDGLTTIGAARIAVAAGTTPFDATTDDLDASHLTVTYYNISMNPGNFDVEMPTA